MVREITALVWIMQRKEMPIQYARQSRATYILNILKGENCTLLKEKIQESINA